MTRTRTTTLALALLAGIGLATGAAAQDRAAGNNDAKAVVPSKEDLKPLNPSRQTLDDNAQRQHDRDRDGGGRSTTSTQAGSTASGQQQAKAGNQATRDWDAIDRNNDNLIQPDEMEAALKEVGPQAKR